MAQFDGASGQFVDTAVDFSAGGLGTKVIGVGGNSSKSAQSAAAGICVGWLAKNFGDAPLRLQNADGELIDEHPFLARLADPWDDYNQDQLLRMVVWDLMTVGSAYIRKVAPQFGTEPAGLEWLNATCTTPFKPEPGYEATDRSGVGGFKHQSNGQTLRYRREDVIWIRYRPTGDLTSAGPLDAVLKAAEGDAALDAKSVAVMNRPLRNKIISPRGENEWDEEQMDKAEAKVVDGGSTQGFLMAFGQEVNVHDLDFTLTELGVDSLGFRQEARVAGAYGLPAILVGLLAGLRWGNNRASTSALIREAYSSGLVPVHDLVARALEAQLLWPVYDAPRQYTVTYDYSQVAALQDVLSQQEQRIVALVEAGIVTENEARQELGYDEEPNGDSDSPDGDDEDDA